MASKKSKILAIAFCAAVMSGIYVNPVLAKDVFVNEHGNVTITPSDFDNRHNGEPDSVTINGIASQKAVEDAQQTANEVAGQIGGLKDDVAGQGKQIGDLEAEVGLQGGQIADLKDDVAGQGKQIGDLEVEVGLQGGQIADLKDDVAGQGKQIGDLEAEVGLQGGQIADLKDDVAGQGKQIGDLEVKNDKQDSAIAGLGALLEEEEDAREKADTAHDQAISDLEVKNDKQDSAIAGLGALLEEEEDAREKADDDLQDQIDGHTNQISSIGKELDDLKANDEAQDGRLDGIDKKNEIQDGRLDGIDKKNEIQDGRLDGIDKKNEIQDGRLDGIDKKNEIQDGRLDGIDKKNEIQDGRLDGIDKKNEQQDNRLDNHEAVMGVSNTDGLHDAYSGTNYIKDANNMAEADVILDREISRVDGRVDRLENRVDKVGAMSAAIANLRTMGYDPAAPTEVAVGVGQYRDETGMALGLFHYPNRDFMLSLSVSTSGDEYMGGIGATWKFGRKSPEKVAEIKKAQAEADARRAEEQKLAKAEEMKKAAKEAKVQAQMERHAKMLAEQEAQA